MAESTDIYSLMWIFGLLVVVLFAFIARRIFKDEKEQGQLTPPDSESSPLPFSTDTKTQDEPAREKITVAARKGATPPATTPTSITPVPATISTSTPAAPVALVPVKANLEQALSSTKKNFFGRIKSLFAERPTIGGSELEQIEEILYTSDLGPQTVQRLLEAVELKLKREGGSGFEDVRLALKDEMLQIFKVDATETTDDVPLLSRINLVGEGPRVLMIVGVNGAGKTTTIGKLSSLIAASGKKVLVAAGDTFRAAAGNQLKVWTERAQVEIFHPEGVQDPSAVAFEACTQAKAKGFDVVIIDTAGRLHTQKNLMEELKKMRRVIGKVLPSAPHEVLLVLDANSGQNALIQAREFHSAVEVSGIVLTKMDGTAKGGVAVGLVCELGLPIKLIGVGEGIEDLQTFSARKFVDSII